MRTTPEWEASATAAPATVPLVALVQRGGQHGQLPLCLGALLLSGPREASWLPHGGACCAADFGSCVNAGSSSLASSSGILNLHFLGSGSFSCAVKSSLCKASIHPVIAASDIGVNVVEDMTGLMEP